MEVGDKVKVKECSEHPEYIGKLGTIDQVHKITKYSEYDYTVKFEDGELLDFNEEELVDPETPLPEESKIPFKVLPNGEN